MAPVGAPAQNTSGVSSPEVKEGDTSLGYRVAYEPSHDARPNALAHRLHFQHAINDSLRFRIIGTLQQRGSSALDFSKVGAEARWQIIESEKHGWDGGVIFKIDIPTSAGRPEKLSIGFPARIDLTDRLRTQAVFYTGAELGENSKPGALVEFRTETTYKIANGVRIGPQYFADLNTTAAIGAFDEQDHQFGFVAKGDLTDRLSFETGVLFGLSAAASDADLRLFLNYAF